MKEYVEPVIEIDELGETIHTSNTPKKYRHKGKFYTRIIGWYLQLKGENSGAASRYLRDIQELTEIAEKQYSQKTEIELEKEIKLHILIFKKYQESKTLSWSLNGVIKNWNQIENKFSKEVSFNVDEV